MASCKDCYSVEILEQRGDGKCSLCFGTGKEQGLGGVGADALGIDRADCATCDGSGECQMCGGTGVVCFRIQQIYE
jgi:hypothetical protein